MSRLRAERVQNALGRPPASAPARAASTTALVALLWCGALSASFAATDSGFERSESREPCADFDPLRRPFFGDTHVHTTFSFDAWGQGTRGRPRDAYRYARGETVGLQPYDEKGNPRTWVRLRGRSTMRS